MALGNNYNNNKDKQNISPTVYSNFKAFNGESFDPSALNFSFWNGMLKIQIAPKKDENSYDWEKGIAVHLHHLKAKQLLEEIEAFQMNPEAYTNLGVASGGGLISISNGIEFTGKNEPCLTIRKLNEQTGAVEASICYIFRNDHYSIRNFEEKTSEYDKIFNSGLEIEMVKTILRKHYEEMSGATAYAVMEYGRFQNARINNKIDALLEAAGVEYKGDKKDGGSRSGSYFDNKNSGSGSTPAAGGSRSYSIDEFED